MSVIQIYDAKEQHVNGHSKVENLFKKTFLKNYHFTYNELYYYFKINMHHAKYKKLKKKLPSYIIKLIINFITLRFNKSVYFFAMIKAFYDFNKLTKK